MPATTVYTAKANLKTLLEAWDWPGADPTIRWGEPIREVDATEYVYFRDTEIEDEHRTLGATRLDETYRITVVIDVHLHGDDEQATEQRAWALHDAIIELLDDNRTLTGAVNRLTDYTVRQSSEPDPEKWRTLITIEVGCVGLITY